MVAKYYNYTCYHYMCGVDAGIDGQAPPIADIWCGYMKICIRREREPRKDGKAKPARGGLVESPYRIAISQVWRPPWWTSARCREQSGNWGHYILVARLGEASRGRGIIYVFVIRRLIR